jgi:hypothetical protein
MRIRIRNTDVLIFEELFGGLKASSRARAHEKSRSGSVSSKPRSEFAAKPGSVYETMVGGSVADP